jgi:hypothetical protein
MKSSEDKSKGVMPKVEMPGYVARFLIKNGRGTFYDLMQSYSDDGFALPESYKSMMAFKDEMCRVYDEKKKVIIQTGCSTPNGQDSRIDYGRQRRKKKYKYPKAFKFRLSI